jgi:gluconate 5-dehydrogenase
MTERVLITGTTRGLGLALLERYVRAGASVIAVNRRRDAELEARYPAVRFECIDVRDAAAVGELVAELARAALLPDVFVLNAGINRIDNDALFDVSAYREVLDTNLFGVLGFVEPLTRIVAQPKPIHVVAIGSTARYVGNPYGLGYHTSKQALSSCFDTLARMYAGGDLIFQQVVLGPVQTPMYTMSAQFPSWMARVRDAFAVSPEAAAEAIARFATTRQSRLYYPLRALPLYGGMWLARSVIPGFFQGRSTLAGQKRRREDRTEGRGP